MPGTGRIRSRPTSDILLLMIAGTVCFAVVTSTITVLILQFVRPEDKGGFAAVADVINTLIGLLAGFLAGRTDAVRTQQMSQRPDSE